VVARDFGSLTLAVAAMLLRLRSHWRGRSALKRDRSLKVFATSTTPAARYPCLR